MKLFAKKPKSNKKRSEKLAHKEVSEDLLSQITGGAGMNGCHQPSI